ncbi:MAG TPA: protein kinase [Roseiflexaceae bacterium]|nr:protein kinase [Roseiflexaceae bacterium]
MIEAGSILQDRYRVVRLLGSGGFGAVYLAEDLRLGRRVALKEMREDRLGDHERQVAIELFEREALMLAQLDHPGLTRVWDYFREDGRACLVMEYVPGLTLRDLLRRRSGSVPESFVVACGQQLCDVLAYLHARQPPVIFRDIKPANVMVAAQDEPELSGLLQSPPDLLTFKLIDFGIARLFKPEQPGDTLIIGTPGYAPPEQYGQGQTDARSDVYALGATLHHLLSGQAPVGMPLPPLDEIAPGVTPGLADAVARATALDPSRRYPDVGALRQDLLAVARAYQADQRPPIEYRDRYDGHAGGSHSTSAPKVTLPLAPALAPQRPRPATRAPLLLVGSVLIALVLGALALGALSRSATGPPRQTRPVPTAASAAGQPSPAPQAGEWQLPDAPGRMAFGRQRADGNYDLLVATFDGAPPRPLIVGGNDTAPAWSPDGGLLAITHSAGDRRGIFVGGADNPAAQLASPPNFDARYAAWSPDGRRVAFTLHVDGVWRLAIAEPGGAVSFPGPERLGWLAWARGALLYAAQAGPGAPQDIYALDVSGAPRNLTNTPDLEEDFPDRSPDGRRIVFVASPPGQQNLPQRQIYIMDADGGGRAQLTQDAGPHTNPVWSPDGRWIAYLSQAGGGDWQVWAMHADGSEPRQITFGSERKFYLAWGK